MTNANENMVPVFPLGFAVPAEATTPDEEADNAAIRALWETYAATVAGHDPDGWLALWDKDGTEMPPNGPVRDHDLLARDAENLRGSVVNAFSVVPKEIVIMGDYAYATGVYALRLATVQETTHHVDGRFMSILRRQDDGSWRIFRGIFNAGADAR